MPELQDFQQGQLLMTAYLRNPDQRQPPPDIEQRRLNIYKDLIYNNVEGFISGAFPVVRSLYGDIEWHALVRDFVVNYQCHSPYFLEISQEFLQFLQTLDLAEGSYPPFMLELAHYEWVELALDVAEESVPLSVPDVENFLAGVPVVSPVAWFLAYQYPVHQIGPDFQPQQLSDQPTYLIVYRNRDEEVKFVESNSVTARLLELLRDNPEDVALHQVLAKLAEEIAHPDENQIRDYGSKLIEEFYKLGIISDYRQAK